MTSAAAMSATLRKVRRCSGKDGASAVAAMSLMLFGDAFPEQPVRTEDQNQDQDGENDGVGPPRRDELVAPSGEEADDKSAKRRSRHVADAAEHRGGERPEPGLIAHPPLADIVVKPLDDACRAGERA